MSFKFYYMISTLATVALAGCSGSGGGPDTASQNAVADHAEMRLAQAEGEKRGASKLEGLISSRLDVSGRTPVSDMPRNGVATYHGAAAYSLTMDPDPEHIVGQPDMLSDVVLNADFSSGAVNGSLHNFTTSDEAPIAGSVAITSGHVVGNDIQGALSGNIDIEEHLQSVSGDIDGFFVGTRHDAIFGEIGAKIGEQPIYGIFGAER